MYICICICIYIKSTSKHLKYNYLSIFTDLLQTKNETKSVTRIYNHIN